VSRARHRHGGRRRAERHRLAARALGRRSRIAELREQLLGVGFGPPKHLPDLPDDLLQEDQVVLFGGYGLGDTWTWDGSNWTNATPATSPPPRFNPSLADDPVLHQVLLFGGSGFNDTWTWNGSAWAQRSPATSPPTNVNGIMVGDPQAGVVLLFGGNANYPDVPGQSGSTWTWDGTTWSLRP